MRRTCLCVLLIWALGMFPAQGSDMTTAQRYAGAVEELEAYLKSGVENEVVLTNCQELFYDIGGAYGSLFGSYTSALLHVIQGKYNMALRFADIVKSDEAFNKYLTSEIESPYILDGEKLSAYVQARQAEAEGLNADARKLYESCYGFFDAYRREEALLQEYCKRAYAEGLAAMDRKDYRTARALFLDLKTYDYKDSAQLLRLIEIELNATPTPSPTPTPTPKPTPTPTPTPTQMPLYKQARAAMTQHQKLQGCIAGGYAHTVGLRTDGTVLAVGLNIHNQCDIREWRDVIAVAAGNYHTIGLKADGKVVAVGYNEHEQCNTSAWRDIVAVAAGDFHTIGLKADGTVVAVGYNVYHQCNTSAWRDIVAIAAGSYTTIGLKADGTVVAIGLNESRQCNTSEWRNIVSVAAYGDNTYGLKKDGTVLVTGSNDKQYLEELSGWRDTVAIAAGFNYAIGYKSDGSITTIGRITSIPYNEILQSDIIAFVSGDNHVIGLKADGTVTMVGNNDYGQRNVSEWSNIGAAD